MAGAIEVTAPPLRAPTSGLVVSARDATADDPDWVRIGVQWQPECPATAGVWVNDCAMQDDEQSAKTIGARPEYVSAEPFTIWTGDVCSTLGGLTQDRQGRATRQLAAATSFGLERVLQNGHANVDIPYLRDANIDDLSPGGSSPLVYALAALDEAAGAALLGGTAFIHATIPTVTLWYAARALEKVGNLLYSPAGNVVVPGAGYTGANPAGTIDASGETAYAYVTGAVQVYLDQIVVLGDERSVDRARNTWEVRAERVALVTFEPCVQAGINVNLCDTVCAPA